MAPRVRATDPPIPITPGTYSVQLTVTGPGGSNTAIKTGYITVRRMKKYSPGYAAKKYSPGYAATTGAPAIVEVGELSVDYLWKHVTLRQTFVDPIVVATPLSKKDSVPATIRIRNIKPTGFDIRVQEWDYLDGIHPPETVSYLAMERGPHTLGTGIRVEAGRMATNLNKTNTYTAVTFKQSFVAVPVVVTSVTSVNATDAVITQEKGVTSTSFQVRLQEQCGNVQRHARETIDYIAWEPSAGTVDGFTFEVHTTPAAVTEQVYTIRFTEYFLTIPMFLAAMQTINSDDPATLRWDHEGPVGVDLQVQEEASCKHSLTHLAEVVGYMAFTYP
jgi:PKD repeat protein